MAWTFFAISTITTVDSARKYAMIRATNAYTIIHTNKIKPLPNAVSADMRGTRLYAIAGGTPRANQM
jgi:hypothetical protein